MSRESFGAAYGERALGQIEEGARRLTVDLGLGMLALLFLDTRKESLGRQGLAFGPPDHNRVGATAPDRFRATGGGAESEGRDESTCPRAGGDDDLVEHEVARGWFSRCGIIIGGRGGKVGVPWRDGHFIGVVEPPERVDCAVDDLDSFFLGLFGNSAREQFRVNLGGRLLRGEDVSRRQQLLIQPVKQVVLLQFAGARLFRRRRRRRGREVGRKREGVEFTIAPFRFSAELLSELSVERVGQGGERSRCRAVTSSDGGGERERENRGQVCCGSAKERERARGCSAHPCQSRARSPPAFPLAPAAICEPSINETETERPRVAASRCK